jgi:predicted hotdog family 3-hydroxylacyl-ACP dehydratase
VAVEVLDEWVPGRARATAVLRGDHPLARAGAADASVLMELIAQAVAACLGREAELGGAAVRNGMVVACRRLELHCASVAAGQRVSIEVERVRSSDQVSQFDGRAFDEHGALLASCSLTLVHEDTPERAP